MDSPSPTPKVPERPSKLAKMSRLNAQEKGGRSRSASNIEDGRPKPGKPQNHEEENRRFTYDFDDDYRAQKKAGCGDDAEVGSFQKGSQAESLSSRSSGRSLSSHDDESQAKKVAKVKHKNGKKRKGKDSRGEKSSTAKR